MFEINEKDIEEIIERVVLTKKPLVFKHIPAKEKKKYIIMCMMMFVFEPNRVYTEKEINELLKPMVEDYVMMRRYMIDYGFLGRTENGKAYWLIKDLETIKSFQLVE